MDTDRPGTTHTGHPQGRVPEPRSARPQPARRGRAQPRRRAEPPRSPGARRSAADGSGFSGPFDPRTGGAGGAGGRPPRPRARLRRRLAAWTGGALSCVILAVSGYGWAVTDAVDSATTRANVFHGLDGRPADTPGTDILIVGSDTRVGLGQATLDQLHAGSVASAAGARSDTMILAHLTADRKSLTLVSIPRDSYVDIPAWGTHPEHHDKINSALNLGGPGLAVTTVERLTGIRIDHYVQVDFSAFASIVDAVGGVDVCLAQAADDPNSGLRLPAGVSHVDGVQALAYVRARYTLTGGSDLGRIHRQQEFLGSLASRIASSQVLADPSRFTALVRSIASAVQTDSGLDTETMLGLALAAKDIPRSRIQFVSMPLSDVNHTVPGVGSTVLWDQALAAKLFAALRRDQPVDSVRSDPAPAAAPGAAAGGQGPATAGAPVQSTSPPPPPAPTTLAVHSADQSICH